MNLKRTRQLVACFFTGIVPEIPEEIIKKRREHWRSLTLERKKLLITKIDERAKARRASMGENATRNNYIFAGLAFITAASTNIMLASTTHTAARSVIRIGAPVILTATSILLLAIAAKSKVMRRKADDHSEADEMLERELQAEQHDQENPDMILLHEYEILAFRLHKRKIILLVERRAQLIATYLAIVGLLILILGFSVS